MIRRGFVYEVEPRRGDPKARRFAVVLSTDARNQSPSIESVIAIPLTTRLRRLPWRVLLPKGTAGLPSQSEAACELIGQWSKVRFHPRRDGEPHPLGGPLSRERMAAILEAIKLATGY
jgi:mRNA-degrading endonuclease toxin of MazEF toxin-antitoxin module